VSLATWIPNSRQTLLKNIKLQDSDKNLGITLIVYYIIYKYYISINKKIQILQKMKHTYKSILQIVHNQRIGSIVQSRRLVQDLVPTNSDKSSLVPYELINTYMNVVHILGYIPMFVGLFHKVSNDSRAIQKII